MTIEPSYTRAVPVVDAAATLALGKKLAPALRAGDTLLLEGGLGAGKTTLARGIVAALCGEEDVPSPTYTLVQTYDAPASEVPALEIWHADLYRLETPADILPLGLLDVRDEVVSLVEWPDRMGDLRPRDALHVKIQFDGEGRRVVFTAPRSGEDAHTQWRERLDSVFD